MAVTDPKVTDNPIVVANGAFSALTGYSQDELAGRNLRFLEGPETDPAAVLLIEQAMSRRRSLKLDILYYKRDGTAFWSSLTLSPVANEGPAASHFSVILSDVTGRKKRELAGADLQAEVERQVVARTKRLDDALTRSALHLQEADHRVRNNLQMISAMLMLQAMSSGDPRTKAALNEMLDRLDSMVLVHKWLYQPAEGGDLDIGGLTREIAGNLAKAAGREHIQVTVETEPVAINADYASSIALLINEVINNAFKTAFGAGQPGRLRISVKPVAGQCEIRVQDDGRPLADPVPKTAFGRTLIETLTQQVRGRLDITTLTPGTSVRITLPLG